jgi:membrane-bound lytic murein transglycosylase MltF
VLERPAEAALPSRRDQLNRLSPPKMKKFQSYVELFKKYGAQYDFDYLMLAAQGYQESILDQDKSSLRGAIGVMQVMPKTAAAKPINIPDIHDAEHNIQAAGQDTSSYR